MSLESIRVYLHHLQKKIRFFFREMTRKFFFFLRYYSYSKIQDYPSIGHINHIAKNKSVNIIWAVTEDKIGLYRTLSNHVFGSSSGTLSFDSSNIGTYMTFQKEFGKYLVFSTIPNQIIYYYYFP